MKYVNVHFRLHRNMYPYFVPNDSIPHLLTLFLEDFVISLLSSHLCLGLQNVHFLSLL